MPNDATYQQQLSQRRRNGGNYHDYREGGNYRDGGSYRDRGQLGGNKGSTIAPPPASNKEGEPSNSKDGGGSGLLGGTGVAKREPATKQPGL